MVGSADRSEDDGHHDDVDPHARRLYWWSLPVRSDKSEDVGLGMLTTVAVWFIALVVLLIVVAAIVSLAS